MHIAVVNLTCVTDIHVAQLRTANTVATHRYNVIKANGTDLHLKHIAISMRCSLIQLSMVFTYGTTYAVATH